MIILNIQTVNNFFILLTINHKISPDELLKSRRLALNLIYFSYILKSVLF